MTLKLAKNRKAARKMHPAFDVVDDILYVADRG